MLVLLSILRVLSYTYIEKDLDYVKQNPQGSYIYDISRHTHKIHSQTTSFWLVRWNIIRLDKIHDYVKSSTHEHGAFQLYVDDFYYVSILHKDA